MPNAQRLAASAEFAHPTPPNATKRRLREWLGEGGFSTITDFDPTCEQLVVVYDPQTHPKPDLTIRQLDQRARSLILLDGCIIAAVRGLLLAKDVRLMPS